MTNAEMTYDVLLRLNQNSDDSEIGYRQVIHWLSLARNESVKRYLEKNGHEIPPGMLTKRECVAMTKGVDCHGCIEYTITLPFEVMDLPSDSGVYAVVRPGRKELVRQGSSGMSSMLSKSRFNDESGWYRVGNEIKLIGSYPESMTFDLLLVAASVGDLEETDQFPAPSDLLLEIAEGAEKIGRRELGGVWDDTNDGGGEPVVKGA